MASRTTAESRGERQSVSDTSCEAQFDPRGPRLEEPSTQATIPCDAVQQTPKNVNPRRVCTETPPPPKSWNENVIAQEVQSKRSRHLEDEAQRKSEATARHRNNNTDIAAKHVNGKRITLYGSCKIDIPEHPKPLPNIEVDELVKAMEFSSFRSPRILELRLLVSDPSSNFFCSLERKPRNLVVEINLTGVVSEKAADKGLASLPGDLQENIFQRLPFKGLALVKAASKSCKGLIEGEVFRLSRGLSGEGEFTAFSLFIKLGEWQWTGFDLLSGEWRRLPTLACFPSPDPNLLQEYSICGHGGLMCANVSKSSHKEELVVFNILTGEKKELPPLNYSRSPVLLHIWVDSVTDSYKVIAAGSASSSGEKDLSRRIEVYDSRTSEWEIGSDIRGPEFGLNEYQVGVGVNGVLHFVVFLDDVGQKGIVAFDIEKGEWLEDRTCAVPYSLFCSTLQLLENSGRLYLFSEQDSFGVVEHCIDVVELWEDSDGEELWRLRTVVRVKKSGGRGLVVYPEYVCVPFGIGQLCVLNTISRDGVVYDLENGAQSEVLEAPPENQRGGNLFCLNPVSFTLAPNFASKP